MQFKKGQSGNPKGRPRLGSDLSGIMKDYLDVIIETDGDESTRGELLVKSMFARAMKGSDGAQRKFMEYMVGLPTQRIQLENLNVKDELAEELRKLRKGDNTEDTEQNEQEVQENQEQNTNDE